MKILTTVLLVVCSNLLFAQGSVIKEGHHGCRGLTPENIIAAMKKALDLWVQVLELDVVLSKDKQVLVSHDPYFFAEISLKPSGEPVTVEDQKNLLLYSMDYSEIKKFDVGSKHNAAFIRQQNFHAYKPFLSALMDSIDKYAKDKGMQLPNFNIEIKSQPQTDDINQPKPQEFVDLVMNVCKSRNILGRMDIQSFDVRPLQLLHQQNINALIKLKVDAIITDYPNLF